jgi:hypothetical protein
MDFEFSLQVTDDAVFSRVGRRLSPVEIAVLRGCWQDQTYEQIADTTGYSIGYLNRTVAPKLWQTLSDSFGEKTGKKNLRFVIERYLRKQINPSPPTSVAPSFDRPSTIAPASVSLISTSPATATAQVGCQIDLDDAMDTSVFYGRQTDLNQLTAWITIERCRLVVLLGMGGIGKTTLAVKLAQQLGSASLDAPFQFIIWRSLRQAPPLATLLADLISFLEPEQVDQSDLGKLLQCLRQSRCLVLLDGLETLLEAGKIGRFRAGYEPYGDLLRLVGETQHQSCVVVTSREKLAEVSVLEGVESAVRSLRLDGSPEAVQAIVQDKGLVGTDAQKQHLGTLYGNNPLALKIVATSIQELFEGNIESFLLEETLVFNGIRRLLDQHFNRLSPLEQSIMYWLAVNHEWTSSSELQADIVPPVSKARFLEALEALSLRSLIEKQTNRYTQQPAVMEYVVEQFTERLVNELKTTDFSLFLNHALLKAAASQEIRAIQRERILQPIANQLSRQFGSLAALEQQILQILTKIRRSADRTTGYGAGNLLNLMHQLGLDLANYDFSNLTVWQADLRTVSLHDVNFTEADLTNTVFAETPGCDYLYDGMNITGVTGLTETQKKLLKQLGAIDNLRLN